MSQNNKFQKPNPADRIPRTVEEMEEITRRMSNEQREDLLQKSLDGNKKIEDALKVVRMFQSDEGWPIFAAEIKKLRELIGGEVAIYNMQGSVLEKGAKVENIQGRMAALEAIQAIIDQFIKEAKAQPIDVAELEKYLEQQKNNN